METLFNGNIIFIFFFAIIAIYNYSDLGEYQRIAIVYISVYSLVITDIVSIKLAMIFLLLTMFCFLEIFTKDGTKFKILVNPIYKVVDCLYLSFFQYSFLEIVLAIILCKKTFRDIGYGSEYLYLILSFILFVSSVTRILQQKFVINSFDTMYSVFNEFPIYQVDFNERFKEICRILVSIEDRTYFEREGYTFLSLDALHCILKRKVELNTFREKVKYTCKTGKKFLGNIIRADRGYSTIPMQLIRSLGIKRGYNYKYRRKIFEFLYAKMFFDGIKRMYDEDKVSNRTNIKAYFLYIYFHQVNTFLGNVRFSRFLNAFDMNNKGKKQKDIYQCSNEGIFIACMGLSKRAQTINKDNIDYYISQIDGNVKIDKKKICKMVSNMMSKPYRGNYLK